MFCDVMSVKNAHFMQQNDEKKKKRAKNSNAEKQK
jgi:hypothetical protein